MTQYTSILESLGLAKNESRIYETLLQEGESGVGSIASVSGVHRRNVYDSLNRLIERGLVFERITSTEHRYQAVDPKKLLEMVKEKEEGLHRIMPELEKMYYATPHDDDVVVYRGLEGWKNYLRDIIRTGENVYTIGAKGRWNDERFSHILAQLSREVKKKNMKMRWLFDKGSAEENISQLDRKLGVKYRILPKGYDTNISVDIFGDNVVILSGISPDSIAEDRSVVMLKNPQTAQAFRTWFELLWSASSSGKNE